uniref:Uncharacterized protein n=1 Tax=Amphilophus citrinellus TaxID=61819 RepID=A0A3Q0SF71_AMPCI
MFFNLFIFLFSPDIIDKSELKTFFESNSSQIYFIFYENFITLESNLKQKGEFKLIFGKLSQSLSVFSYYGNSKFL